MPKHEILQQLLKMNLDQLEELSLDRWGKNKEGNRKAPSPQNFIGIGNFKKLKKLDLSFNDLPALPNDFFELKKLEEINLAYNKLPKADHGKIAKAFPNAKIIFS